MQPEDFAYLYELESDFWWFVGMREITAALLDPVCPPGIDRRILDDGAGAGGNLSWLKRYAEKAGGASFERLRRSVARKVAWIGRHDVKLNRAQPDRNISIPR